jgi:hypothetical protein
MDLSDFALECALAWKVADKVKGSARLPQILQNISQNSTGERVTEVNRRGVIRDFESRRIAADNFNVAFQPTSTAYVLIAALDQITVEIDADHTTEWQPRCQNRHPSQSGAVIDE